MNILDKKEQLIDVTDFKCNESQENDSWLDKWYPYTMFSINGPLLWADYSTIGGFLIRKKPIIVQGESLFKNFEGDGGYYLKKIIPIEDINYRYKFFIFPMLDSRVIPFNTNAYPSGWYLKYCSYFDNKYTKYYTNSFFKWLANGKPNIFNIANASRFVPNIFKYVGGWIWLNYGTMSAETTKEWVEATDNILKVVDWIDCLSDIVKLSNSIQINRIDRLSSRAVTLVKDIPDVVNLSKIKEIVNINKQGPDDIERRVIEEVADKSKINLFKDILTNIAYDLALDYILGSVEATFGFPAYMVMDNLQINTPINYKAEVVGISQSILNNIEFPSNADIGKTDVWLDDKMYNGMTSALYTPGAVYNGADNLVSNVSIEDGTKIAIQSNFKPLLVSGVSGYNQVVEPFKTYIYVDGYNANLVVVGVEHI